MTTKLSKPVKRVSNESRYESGKLRPIIVTIYPAGFIGLRLQGTRREETMPIEAAWERAIKMRVAQEAEDKLREKAELAGIPISRYRAMHRKRK